MNLYVSLMAFHKPLGHPSPGLLRSSSETFPSLSRSYWQIYFCPRSTPRHPLCFSSLLSPTGQQTRFYDMQRIIQHLVPHKKWSKVKQREEKQMKNENKKQKTNDQNQQQQNEIPLPRFFLLWDHELEVTPKEFQTLPARDRKETLAAI